MTADISSFLSIETMILSSILFLSQFSQVRAIVGGYENEPHRQAAKNKASNMI